LLTGFDQPNSGDWTLNGKSLKGVPPHKVSRMGMVRTFQLTKALFRLSVLDNMRLGARDQIGEGIFRSLMPFLWKREEEEITVRARELLTRFKMIEKQDDFAAALSGGQRKLLEMARALMTNPELVMLDEPMAGVNPALTQSLLGHIKDLREQGMTVLFVEHDMDMVRDISDWVIVMAQGKIVAEGPPDVVMSDQAVIDAYLGAHHDVSLDKGE
jgi:branched-chain amino acid transport system ATP-binding protein